MTIAIPCILRSDVLTVKPIAQEHAESLFLEVCASHKSLSYWLAWCKDDYSLPDAAAWIEHSVNARREGTEYSFGVFTQSGELIGCVGLTNCCLAEGTAELGYWIGERFRGRGYAQSAARHALSFGFKQARLASVDVAILPANHASIRVVERLGAGLAGRAPNRISFQGRMCDALIYRFDGEQWRNAGALSR